MNKEKLIKKYLKLIEQENKIQITPETESNYERCYDEESYHVFFDNILVELINELGYQEIVDAYEKARKHFWYS